MISTVPDMSPLEGVTQIPQVKKKNYNHLGNGVMMTPKNRFLSLFFTCLKKKKK